VAIFKSSNEAPRTRSPESPKLNPSLVSPDLAPTDVGKDDQGITAGDTKTRGPDTVTHVRLFQRIVGALTFLVASIASAQNAQNAVSAGNSAAADSLSEVVVTARRIEERLQDVPISITVFNQAQLADRNIVNAQDLATYTPSLSATTNYGPDNSTYAIRGFVQDAGTLPSVGVYFADVVLPRGSAGAATTGNGAGPGDFFDLQNVQVLKGPQGTLFGRNTTGGAVLFVPQKPTSEFGGYVEASFGNYDMHRVQAALNVPLNDAVRVRLAMDHEDRDGYLKNDSGIGPSDFADIDYTAVRASVVVAIRPDLENYLIGSFLTSDTNGSLEKVIACARSLTFGASFACPQIAAQQAKGAGFYTIQSDIPDPESKLRQFQFVDTTTWRTSDNLTIKNIASYAQELDELRTALFGTDWRVAGEPLAFSFLQYPPGSSSSDQSTGTEELQLQGKSADDRLSYQAGGYLEVSNPLEPVGAQSPTLVACSNVGALQCTDYLGIADSEKTGFTEAIHVGAVNYAVSKTTYRDYGLYAQGSYSFTDTLKMTDGIRYTWDQEDSTSTAETFLFPVLPPFTGGATSKCTYAGQVGCTESLTERSRAPTWLIDLDYKPIDDVLAYAKYSRGYRSGGIVPSAPAGNQTFEPEKVDAYEAGAKTSFQGPLPGTFDVSGFYNDFRNQQLLAGFVAAPGAGVSPTSGIVNAGKSRIYGVEVETSINPFAGLNIEGSYTYLNTKIQSISPIVSASPNYVVNVQIPAGAPLELSPRNKLSFTGSYTFPFSDRVGKVILAATYTHIDSQLAQYAFLTPAILAAYGGVNYGTLPALDLLNMNLDWKDIGGTTIDVSAFVTNLTDKEYYTFTSSVATYGFQPATLGEPRMFGLRVRYRFGK
jgi:iron complex outermembrane receptor protein